MAQDGRELDDAGDSWRELYRLRDQRDALLTVVRRAAEEPCYCLDAAPCACLGPLAAATLARVEDPHLARPAQPQVCDMCLRSPSLRPSLPRLHLRPEHGASLRVCLVHTFEAAVLMLRVGAGALRVELLDG